MDGGVHPTGRVKVDLAIGERSDGARSATTRPARGEPTRQRMVALQPIISIGDCGSLTAKMSL